MGVACFAVLAVVRVALGCPFCTVESRTLSEEIASSDAAVIARLVAEAPPVDMTDQQADPDAGQATFAIVDVISGQEAVSADDRIQVVYFGDEQADKRFFITGIGTDPIEWMTPLPLSETAVDFIGRLPALPAAGADRLAFFQEYLENNDPLLAQDAYDEFARAPYADVKDLKGRMHHDRLVAWIADPSVNPSRRRLYLTMLGVCGNEGDLPMLEELILADMRQKKPLLEQMTSVGLAQGGPLGLMALVDVVEQSENRKKLGLDATIACYLTLRGEEGLDLIDERFLSDPDVEYTHGYSTIMALRFLGEETDLVPRPRLLESMRLMLDNPDFADQVILDLSRWEDWSAIDRLTEMFQQSEAKSYVRQPIVTYLTVASEQPGEVGQRATAALAELEALDPESVKRARSLMAFGYLARARSDDKADQSAGVDPAERQQQRAEAGLVATAEEMESAENAAPGDFPDPATFAAEPTDQRSATGEPADQAAADDSAGSAGEPAGNTASTSPPVEESGGANGRTSPDVEAYSPVLVVGVPLAAAAVLLGLYWFILRIGAG